MINANRVVPVERVDLLSLYGLVLLQNSSNSGLIKLAANTIDGDFQITDGSAPLIADQPVMTVDIDATDSSVTAATLYFVADYNYTGFTIDGAAVTTAGVDVVPDAVTLYKAVLATGTVTISKVGF
jgi:hypothetical protein